MPDCTIHLQKQSNYHVCVGHFEPFVSCKDDILLAIISAEGACHAPQNYVIFTIHLGL